MGSRDSRSRSRGRGGRSPPRRSSPGRGRSPRDRSRSGGRDRSRSGGRDGGRSRVVRDRTPDNRPGVDTEEVILESGAVAYLLGRGGATKARLANFSGARLEIDPKGSDGGRIQIIGTEEERKMAQLCISITLQQRNNGKVEVQTDMLEKMENVSTLDVDQNCVGFVLGSKGATLREFETKFHTFMFFDNDNIRNNKKRLYILGTDSSRAKALAECENAVNFKLSGNGGLRSWREGGGDRPRYDENYRRSPPRSSGYSGGGGGYGDRGRDYGGDRDRDRDRDRRGYDDRRGGYDDRRDDRRGGYDDRRDDRRGGYDDRRDDRRGGYDDRRDDRRR